MLKRVLAIAVIGAAALTSVGACASDYGTSGTWGSGYRSAALLPGLSVGAGAGIPLGTTVCLSVWLPSQLRLLERPWPQSLVGSR